MVFVAHMKIPPAKAQYVIVIFQGWKQVSQFVSTLTLSGHAGKGTFIPGYSKPQ